MQIDMIVLLRRMLLTVISRGMLVYADDVTRSS